MDSTFKRENRSDNLLDNGNEKPEVLVMCIGNYLMGDEGIGVHIAKEMNRQSLPSHIEVIDAGTGGFSLMGYFDEYPAIIIVDATMDGEPPGTICNIKPKFASDFPKALSTHDIGLKDMIEVVYMKDDIPIIRLITISISSINPMSVELSPPLQQCIPEAIDKVIALSDELMVYLADKMP